MTDDYANDVLTSALRYASQGIYVFPVRIGVRGSNGNAKKDVHPIADWKSASTTDADTIGSWFTGAWATAALGIDCGKSGLVGIDADVSDGKSGPANWAALPHEPTARVLTPSGGFHDYYRADPDHLFTGDNTGAVADGVDTRGLGGFLFAPPSIDPRGGRWQWRDAEMPDFAALPMVPEVVVKRMEAARADKRPKIAEHAQRVTHEDPFINAGSSQLFAPYGQNGNGKTHSKAVELLDRERRAFLALTEAGNGRSHILAQSLGVLAGHGVDVFWSYSDARDTLLGACRENGFTDEHGETYALQQLTRGLEYGMREPWTKVDEPTGPSAGPGPEQGGLGRLRRALLTRSQVSSLPDPVPLIDQVLYRNSVTVLSGKFGTYKSFVAISWAACLATGVPWFGHPVPRAVPVIYAAAEGAYGLKRRIDAWERAHGITVPDSMYLIPISVRLNRPEDMRELEELIVETGAQALVFDTLHASTPGVDENDAGEMGNVMDVLRGLQERHGLCSILPHHTGHAGERARGSSSVEDDADVTFVIRLDGEDRGQDARRVMAHRKTKDGALLPDVELKLKLIEGTGSGHVMPLDAWDEAQGRSASAGRVDPWLASISEKDVWRTRVINVLYHLAPFPDGWTRPELNAFLKANYPDFRPNSGAYKRVLRDLKEAVDEYGEPVIGGVSGDRCWGIASEAVRAQMPERPGPSGTRPDQDRGLTPGPVSCD